MTIFFYSVTAEATELTIANRWVVQNSNRRNIRNTSNSRAGALSGVAANDRIVLFGHGSPTEIGTANSSGRFQVSLNPQAIFNLIIGDMGLTPNVAFTIYIACCDTTAFATALDGLIGAAVDAAGLHTHLTVNCIGSAAGFVFPTNMPLGY